MKSKLLLLQLLITSLLTAQNWAYVGNMSVTGNTVSIKSHGNAETVFKTDGTPISICMNGNSSSSGPHILPKTFNGSSWVNLGAITTTGNIGAIDTEIYNNEPYVAYRNRSIKSKKIRWHKLGKCRFKPSGIYIKFKF
ncbi:MAG: hypothetical protein IPJ32_08755 [Sphingobacteriaceae bacterium]|nr:hypothetical protein [Sphingobacteriaceae bacterium]